MVKPKPHNHSFGYNVVHIVFVTKYRHPVITDAVVKRLTEMFARLCETQDCEMLECKADLGKRDHIHLLVDLAPKISLGKLCNILKTISSREIRKEFAQQLKPYYWKPKFWKQGYGYTSSGGAPIEILIRYIENQGFED
ncbi:transposase IS200-family protein [Stanieria cyanosphaera PCC 7437]|uniref:Transposase IS200-family protein n=1 Tax=Stanieria cyanosphaera (strain ATCC 29371 / PCC 7437) TaxID=111780 RepID=K9XYA0_STAC7|nr:IS200/IS605 family transposase [Stanieria cyanosphaera]AFZ37081.1 transposase IS200-family protein [Stanieria cyanosphaera PCC 7437]